MRLLALLRNWLVHLALWALVWLAFTLGQLYGLVAWGLVIALWAIAWGLSQAGQRVMVSRSKRPDPELGRQLSALYEGIQGAFILEARRASRGARVQRGQFFLDAGAASVLTPRERLAYAVHRIELTVRRSRHLNYLLSYVFIGALVALLALGALAGVTRGLGRELPELVAVLPVVAILTLAVPALFPDLFTRRHLLLADRATAQAVDPQALAGALSKLRQGEEIPGWYELVPARPPLAERLRLLEAPAPRRAPPRPAVPAGDGAPLPPQAAFLEPSQPTNGAAAAAFLEAPPRGWRATPTKPLPEVPQDVPPAVREAAPAERPRRLRRWWRR